MEREELDWVSRELRQKVNLAASVRCGNGETVRVLISNISYMGCHFWSDREFERGETVTLLLSNAGEMPAHVRWATDGKVGVRFLTGASSVDARRARLGV